MGLREIKITVTKGKGLEIDGTIRTSQDAFRIFKELFDKNTFLWTEEIILLCLNKKNKVMGYYKVSKGGTASSICDAKIIFTIARNCGGPEGIILAHNHPSGNTQPGEDDKRLTERIKNAGEILGIPLLDHIVLGESDYTSFQDEGIL